MACACGKKNGSGQWVHTDLQGRSTTYNTEVEAKAASIRKGGTVTAK